VEGEERKEKRRQGRGGDGGRESVLCRRKKKEKSALMLVYVFVAGTAGRVTWPRHGAAGSSTTTPTERLTHYVHTFHHL